MKRNIHGQYLIIYFKILLWLVWLKNLRIGNFHRFVMLPESGRGN